MACLTSLDLLDTNAILIPHDKPIYDNLSNKLLLCCCGCHIHSPVLFLSIMNKPVYLPRFMFENVDFSSVEPDAWMTDELKEEISGHYPDSD
jgi:hypothetical protein